MTWDGMVLTRPELVRDMGRYWTKDHCEQRRWIAQKDRTFSLYIDELERVKEVDKLYDRMDP